MGKGRAEVVITDEEGNTATINNDTLREDGISKGAAKGIMKDIVANAKAGNYNNVDPSNLDGVTGFEYNEVADPTSEADRAAAEVVDNTVKTGVDNNATNNDEGASQNTGAENVQGETTNDQGVKLDTNPNTDSTPLQLI